MCEVVDDQGRPMRTYPPSVIDAILAAYPRKVKMELARGELAGALHRIALKSSPPSDPAAWLLAKVREFAASPAGQAGAFTPHFANWLENGQYDDDPAEWHRQRAETPPAAAKQTAGDELRRRQIAAMDRATAKRKAEEDELRKVLAAEAAGGAK